MRYLLILVLLAYSVFVGAQSAKTILPAPQQVTYGKGQLPVKGLSYRFANAAVTEDKFAAKELAGIISDRSKGKLLMRQATGQVGAIVFKRTGNVDALPVVGEKPGRSSREFYKISITSSGINISSPSSAGLYYAVQTIRQLLEGTGDKLSLPFVEIEDWPSLAYRGFMMDMSHMQFPKVEEIKQQLDFLARWKTNQYFFYSESSIELDGYPLLMANARFTKAQIKDIIDYARERHIDVVPNMELYGHLHDLFKLEHYSDLSVTRYGGEFKPRDERVRVILNDWITQVAKLFPSPFFHIGFDETWVIELEAKKLQQTPDELYFDMLKQTTDMVAAQGKQSLVWADMLQKYHRIIPKLSRTVTAVPWHYFPLKEAEYDTLLSPFAKAGIPMIVQGATINWHWLYPSFEISFKNNNLLIAAGRKYDAVGYINSGWTDDPQTLMRLSRPDMAYGSVAAWQNAPVDQAKFMQAYAASLYPTELAGKVEKAHHALMQSESLIRSAIGQTDFAIWEDPFTVKSLKLYEAGKDNLHKGRLAAEEAQVYLREALKYGVDTVSLFAMLTGAKELDLVSMKYLFAGDIAEVYAKYTKTRDQKEFRMMMSEVTAYYHSKTVDMFDAIVETKEMFRTAWLNEYTPFRLGIPMAKFDMELQYWFKVQKRIDGVKWNIKENEELPSLQSLLKD